MAELMTLGPILIVGGGMVASDNNRSTLAKFYRYVRDKIRIHRMSSSRNKHRGARYSIRM